MQHEKTTQALPALQACWCRRAGRILRAVLAAGCEEGEQIVSVKSERQQFEDAYWNGGVPIMLVGTREAIFARKDNGEYRLSHAEGAWTGWKLARKNKGLLEFIEKASEVESDFAQSGKIHGS